MTDDMKDKLMYEGRRPDETPKAAKVWPDPKVGFWGRAKSPKRILFSDIFGMSWNRIINDPIIGLIG